MTTCLNFDLKEDIIFTCVCACVCVCMLTQLCLTLWYLTDCTLSGSSVHGTLQARTATGMGCHFLLQGIFPTQRSKLCLLHLLHWQFIILDSKQTFPLFQEDAIFIFQGWLLYRHPCKDHIQKRLSVHLVHKMCRNLKNLWVIVYPEREEMQLKSSLIVIPRGLAFYTFISFNLWLPFTLIRNYKLGIIFKGSRFF